MREDARPSPYDQARAVIDALTVAKAENIRGNIIEAFDQPWKRALEGAVGGYWGIIDRSKEQGQQTHPRVLRNKLRPCACQRLTAIVPRFSGPALYMKNRQNRRGGCKALELGTA